MTNVECITPIVKFESSMLKSSLCDCSEAYILVKGTISVSRGTGNNIDNKVIFENCAPFTDWIREISNTQVDNAKDIDIVILMYNLTESSDNNSKTSVRKFMALLQR